MKKLNTWLLLDQKQIQYFWILIVISLAIKALVSTFLLPYYSIDENEVVEAAIAFITGDLDPRFYKYGHLTSYVLAVVYYIYAVIVSVFNSTYISYHEVLYEAFFLRYDYYFLARFVQGIMHIIIAIFIYRIALLYYSKRTAWISLIILLSPILDFHNNYTVRVDSTLALFYVLTAYFYLRYIDLKENKYLYGIFIALACAFASKPMPALFAFICLLHPFWQYPQKLKFIGIFLLTFIAVSLIVNPYFILKFKAFYNYNYESLFGFQTNSDEMKSYAKGYELFFLAPYGMQFKIISIFTLIYSVYYYLKKKNEARVQLQFLLLPMTYFICFSNFHSRYYWFIVIIPFIILWSIDALDKFSMHIKNERLKLSLLLGITALFMAEIFYRSFSLASDIATKDVALSLFEKEADTLLKRTDKILFIGNQSRSPLFVDMNIQNEANKGQYFMYERMENKGYVDFFKRAHNYWVRKKKTYQITFMGQRFYENFKGDKYEKLVYEQLHLYAKQNGIEYIMINSYSQEEIKPIWESEGNVELLVNSYRYENCFGPFAKLYRIK